MGGEKGYNVSKSRRRRRENSLKLRFCAFATRWQVSSDSVLVLVFATTFNGAETRMFDSEKKMAKLLKCRFSLEKIRMNYSCHDRYKGIHIVFRLFSLLSC